MRLTLNDVRSFALHIYNVEKRLQSLHEYGGFMKYVKVEMVVALKNEENVEEIKKMGTSH